MRHPFIRILYVSFLGFPAIALAQDVEAGTVQFQRAAIDPDTGGLIACSPPAEPGMSQPPPEGVCTTDPILVVDASNNNLVFPIPNNQRQFTDIDDFVNFAKNDLNAMPVVDENGATIGVRGTIVELEQSAVPDENNQDVKPVDDPVSAYIAGGTGDFSIGANVYGFSPSRLPSSSVACTGSGSGTDCVQGRSWNTHWSFIFSYADVGSSTQQYIGGYQVHSYFCWKWFIPWICTSASGTNRLFIANSMFVPSPGAPPIRAAGTGGQAATNVTSITYHEWGVWFGPTQVTPLAGRLVGACGRHSNLLRGETARTGAGEYNQAVCP